MIKKAQLKFVCIVMSILLGVFAVIFGTSYYFSYNQTLSNIEHSLDGTVASYYLPNGMSKHADTIIALVDKNHVNNTYSIKKLTIDEQAFSQENAENIVFTAINRVHKSGKIDNVFYKIYNENTSSSLIVVAIDCADVLMLFSRNTSRVFFTLLIIYFLLLFLVMKLSWAVLKPLRDTIDKQREFVSNASHELKTPISIISANADVLSADTDNKWIDNIKSQTERMSVLVEDMLSLAKIDEGQKKLKVEKFNLSNEVLENALPFDAVAFEKGKTLNIDIQPDITYNGDRDSVKQIVNILLDNAVKHADKNGEITLTLKKDGNKTIITFFNTGSQIPEENADKIFERFYRGDSSRSRESGGSGLGLAIAKSIADTNKWKISAVSKLNVSMTITIIL